MNRKHPIRILCLGALLALPLFASAQPTFGKAEPAIQMEPLVYPETPRGCVSGFTPIRSGDRHDH